MTTQRKIALITGANKGIGHEAARQLAQAGFHVLLGARDVSRGEDAAMRLRDQGLSVEFIALDVTDQASISAAAADIAKRFGKLDVLVNNAGVNLEYDNGVREGGPDLATLRGTFDVNVFGLFAVSQAFTPLIEKSRGRIINVSSTLGSISAQLDPDHPWYANVMPAYNASKSAVNALTVAMSKLLAAKSVSVTAICPGWVRTDMGSEAAPRSVEEGAAIITRVATMEGPPSGAFVDDNGPISW